MTEYVTPLQPEDNAPHPSQLPPNSAAERTFPVPPTTPTRLPLSQFAIWGFVLSCVSIFVFGFIGALGAMLSSRGFRAARQGTARGRGLAIAGMIIGVIGFLYYAINFIVHRL